MIKAHHVRKVGIPDRANINPNHASHSHRLAVRDFLMEFLALRPPQRVTGHQRALINRHHGFLRSPVDHTGVARPIKGRNRPEVLGKSSSGCRAIAAILAAQPAISAAPSSTLKRVS